MLLIDLPTDILNLLPGYLESLDDLHSLILTSRELYATTSKPTPSVIYSLATSPHTGIQPYPHLFIAVKARTLADWAVQSSENQERLFDAINTGGPSGVLDLALSVSPLTLNDLTFLRHTRTSILEPAIKYLETKCGPSDEIDPSFTVCHNVTLLLTNYWIYCDLFYHNITAPVLRRAADLPPLEPLSNETRLEWVYHFLPDCNAVPQSRVDMT
ncbi:hypothetical protein A0H81_00380 [Grifola frondosa]|uniref:Uncharacterized protein n=1 Tax=Grifola frondosa TaxID=5627 RepID=A0A1C7MQU6_GRIFR|nr:hypothetical protein A0H81_00380 [Grifola frondosa]